MASIGEIDAKRVALRAEVREREQPVRDLVRTLFAIEDRKVEAKRARSAAVDQVEKDALTAEVRSLAGAVSYAKKRLRKAVH